MRITEDELRQLIDDIYSASYNDALWREVMPAIKSHLNVSQATIGFFDAVTREQDSVYGDCTPYFAELFHSLGRSNPFVGAMTVAPIGHTIVDQAIMSTETFERTDFFNVWLRPQEEHSALAMKMVSNGSVGGFIGLTRGGQVPKFDAEELTFMQELTPALVRVAGLRHRIGRLNLERESRNYDRLRVGFIVTDAQGTIFAINEMAGRMLDEGTLLRRQRAKVVAGAFGTTARLHAAIGAAAGTPDTAPMPSHLTLGATPDAPPRFAITLHPMPDANSYGLPIGRGAVLFVQDLSPRLPQGFETHAQHLFGLTVRESGLAAALASGRSLKEFADAAFISMPTARTHLSQIFRKTGTTQQSQLVALLLSALPPVPYD